MNREQKKTLAGIILFAAFSVLLIAGYISGEAEIVMKKAVNICLECIGVG